jgi:hypothetical protein
LRPRPARPSWFGSARPWCARLPHALRRRKRVVARAWNPGATTSRSLSTGQSAGRTRPWAGSSWGPTDITRARRRPLGDRAWGGRGGGSAGSWQLICSGFAGIGLSILAGRGDLTWPSVQRRLQRGARWRRSLNASRTIGLVDDRFHRRGSDARRCFTVGVSGGSRSFGGRLLRRLLGRRRLARELFFEPSFDRRLHGGRGRSDELSHVLQHAEDGLAFDSELLGELVDTDLWHCSPCWRSGSRSGPVSCCACSLNGSHREVMSDSPLSGRRPEARTDACRAPLPSGTGAG